MAESCPVCAAAAAAAGFIMDTSQKEFNDNFLEEKIWIQTEKLLSE